MRPWVPGPTGNKRCRQNPKKGASIAPALEALPLALTRARGWGDPLYPLRCDHLLGFSRQSVAAERKGEKKQNKRTHEDPCRLASQEKASEGPRRIPKTPGGMAPRQNAKKRDARPKRAEQRKAAGHTKEKKPEKQVRVQGCPVTT